MRKSASEFEKKDFLSERACVILMNQGQYAKEKVITKRGKL